MKMKTSSIAFRLGFFCAFMLLSLAGVGIGNWVTLKSTYESQSETLDHEASLANSIDLARDAQVNFKIQVQDFKDILLRGQDPDFFQKYLKEFNKQYEATQTDLKKLDTEFTVLGMDLALVEEIRINHQELNNVYLNSLKQFDASKPENIYNIDRQLRGIDRIPTERMDNMVAYVQAQSARLRREASRQTKANFENTTKWIFIIITLAFIIGLTITVKMIHTIRRQLALALDLTQALTRGTSQKLEVVKAISDGNLDQELIATPLPFIDNNFLSNDEIGDMVRDVLEMSALQSQLDAAFIKMSVSLRQNRAAELANDWLKSGQNELNTIMEGEQDTAQQASKVLAFLIDRVHAAAGLFYLHDESSNQLKLLINQGSDKDPLKMIAKESGLIGRALEQEKIIELNDVPAEYLPVASGWGNATPCSVLVIPLINGWKCIGAVELGSFHHFSALELDFLNSVKESIAIGFDVNLSRLRTVVLLEETRQQTEELQVQQEELQQSNEELEERAEMLEQQREQIRIKNQEVELASAENRRKNVELEIVSKYKSEFMANMSHELRTPLNSMLILSGLLKENKDKSLTDKQVEYAATINNAGKDLLNLINDILDLSKVEAGQIEFSYGDIRPAEICSAMSGLFTVAAEHKGLAFHTEVADNLPATLYLDVHRIQQILKNLIANALKFTEAGNVKLKIYSPAAQDNPLISPAIAFSVSDTGIGVPMDKQSLIFDAFKQADGGISRKYGGTGLGLSISLRLARKMDGELLMTSVEGKGSSFTLYLPQRANLAVQDPASKNQADRLPSESTQALMIGDDRKGLQPNAHSILIIEDDINFAKILLNFVRERGFYGIVGGDGETGINLAQQYLPCAILLDVKLPKMTGWEVIENLKGSRKTQHIPVHFITSHEDKKRALDLGAAGFVMKPVNQSQLESIFEGLEQSLEKSVKKLLIIEDDEVESHSMLALFSQREISVSIVTEGKQAIELMSDHSFDCIVLDLDLSDGSGSDVLQHIHQRDPLKRIPVIIYSGQEAHLEREKKLQHYAQSIIIKGSKSPERLLDEVTLFLHMVDTRLESPDVTTNGSAHHTINSLAGKKVLLVDDDMRNIFSLSSLLSNAGINVIEAENGLDALASLNEHSDIDLVLMDIMMPEMDGYEAMRAIRKQPHFYQLPIIAMTAKAMLGDQQKCLDAGANDYISKPIDALKLISMLQVWITRK